MNEDKFEETDSYVFLDFNGKLLSQQIQGDVFLRIANLHKNNPLVQVNDTVFKGNYDHSMGTNLFFKDCNTPQSSTTALFKQTPISLEYFKKQTKVISLKQMRVPPRKALIQDNETIRNISYKLDWDYNELLKNFEDGTLDLKDIIISPHGQETNDAVGLQETNLDKEEEIVELSEISIQSEHEHALGDDQLVGHMTEIGLLKDISPGQMLEQEYKELELLAHIPTKRALSPELVEESDIKFKKAYEYHNLECEVLQPSYIPRSGYTKNITEETLVDNVNIDRCVLYGLIAPSQDYHRTLTPSEKETVLCLDNFDNLSLSARYYVIRKEIENLEIYINGLSEHQLLEKDEHHRTPLDTLEVYKKLSTALETKLRGIFDENAN